jgi:glycosyltransferase involved in cell wall biosynthesis
MRVLVHPADTGACGHYRLIWPSLALQEQGADVLCGDPSLETKDWPEEMKIYGVWMKDERGEERLLRIHNPPDCDVFVMQRPLGAQQADLLELMRDTPVATVIEVDDDFTSIHPQNISFWATHPGVDPRRSWHHMIRAMDAVDLITVSTLALKKVYGKFTKTPIVVIPNYVPSWYLTTNKAGLAKPTEDEDKLLLGWSGSLETHPVDLQQVGGAVAQVLRDHDNVKLTIVGTGKGAARALGTKAGGEILTTGWVPLGQYPSVMKELDIGIVPLQMSQFNEGKSWLKGLEWASLGVPFVASPTQQYVELEGRGAGYLAANPRTWKFWLDEMIKSEDFRHETAERGKVAAQGLVMQDHLERWMAAWQSARDLKSQSSGSSKTAHSISSSPTMTVTGTKSASVSRLPISDPETRWTFRGRHDERNESRRDGASDRGDAC